jgi:alpha-ketoglutarate-dependent 2,4-dichlorophenoxyacetate dioxygenase
LTDAQHIAFTRAFGPLQTRPKVRPGRPLRLPFPELADAGNLDEQGNILAADDRRRAYSRGNQLWHTDASFNASRARYSILSAHVVPEPGQAGSGDTEFADMRAAYDALTPELQTRLADAVAEHCIWHSRQAAGYPEPTAAEKAERPPSRHRLVHVHAGSGRTCLYLAAHISGLVGWDEEEGRHMVETLMAHATQPHFVYAHRWQVGDMVMWDNLATMHRARPYDSLHLRRDLRRTTVLEAA